jgi:hypothetical protein
VYEMPSMTPDGSNAAATANARILLRMLSRRGNGRYLARARGVVAFTGEAAVIGVTPGSLVEGIV